MTVEYRVNDRIAEIVLAAPPVNALALPMIRDIIAGLERAAADPDVRCVILTSGVPRYFSAGLDLAALQDTKGEALRDLLTALYIDLADAQHALGKPSIAAVTGAARGGGMTLAISCNVIVAATQASFGYPEIDAGVLPAIHLDHLPRIVGRHRAFELLFTGRAFDAGEAAQLGLVSRIASDALSEARVLALAFAGKPPEALAAGHRAFMNANDRRGEIAKAVDTFCAIASSGEAQEGMAAFMEKRRPSWLRD